MSNYQKFGIDVSHWQGAFDFSAAVKSDAIEFAIIKAGGTTEGEHYADSKFKTNYKNAKAAGLHVGAYYYGGATTTEEAEEEAVYFDTLLKGKEFDIPVYYDVEESCMLGLSKANLTKVIQAFCDKMESLGYYVGIYMSRSAFQTEVTDSKLTDYAHWVAEWNTTCAYDGSYGMWQFGGERNKIRDNEINGQVVDMDYMLIDYPSKIKAAGLNGYAADSTAETESSITTGSKIVLNNVNLYATSTTNKVSKVVSGTYYVWSDTEYGKGRIKITTSKSYVGKAGYVTGWVNVTDI